MIVLTAEQASAVRGRSPEDAGAALDPVPLKDGRFMLGDEVLSDPAHEDVWPLLAKLPVEPVEKLPTYTEADDLPPKEERVASLSVRASLDATGPEELAPAARDVGRPK